MDEKTIKDRSQGKELAGLSVVQKLSELIVGSQSVQSVESRILNGVCFFSFLGIIACVIFNCLIGLYELAGILSSFLILQVIIYYLSRFTNRTTLATALYAIASYLFLSCNYIYNDGLTGPTLLAFFVSFHFLVHITTEKYNWIWVALHITVVAALSIFQYTHPQAIANRYPNTRSQFIDMNFTFYVLIIITFVITRSIRKRYFEEKGKVARQAAVISQKNAYLQYIDGERNRLFSIISHDLRTPLNSIQGYLEILQEMDLSSESRVDMERQLLTLTKDTNEMLGNLLSWSKARLQQTTVNLELIPVYDTLRNSVQVSKAVASRKNIIIEVDIDEKLRFVADKGMMDIVVRNLLSNAVKFSREGGIVRLVARQRGDEVAIEISDQGTGMSGEQKKHVFSSDIKPLPGTGNEQGMGLGLMLCAEFIEAQNGAIGFTSELGKGTTFTISMPGPMSK